MSMAEPRRRRPWPLSVYMVGLVVLAVVAAGGATFYAAVQAERNARSNALGDAGYAAKAAAGAVAGGITQLQQALGQVARVTDVAQIAKAPADCTLGWAKVGVFPTGHIDILRADGSVVCSSRTGNPTTLRGYAGAPWLAAATTASLVRAPVPDSAAGGQAVLLSWPARGGMVVAFLALQPAGVDLAGFAGPGNAELLLTDSGATRVLARSINPAKWTGAPLAGTPFAAAGNSVDRPDVDGRQRLYAAAPVASVGWTVYAGADRRATLANAEDLNRNSLLLIGGSLVLACVAAAVIQRRVTGPIRTLGRAVAAAVPQAGAAPISVRGPAEISELAEGFNTVMAAVATELAERRRAEAAARDAEESARRSERTYRMLFENNPLPMWVYDLDTLRFLRVNDAAVQRYGWSREEFLAMTIRDIRPAEDIPLLEDSAHTDSVAQRSGPWRHLTRDGRTLLMEVTSHSIEADGRRARFVMAEDVTERERLQQQLQQSQRLESLGQLAGGVAHDFNNLLAVIMNYSAFVKESVAGAAERDDRARWQPVHEDVEQIELAANRAAALVHQLLAFARREVVQPKVLDLNAVIAGIEPLLQRSIGEHISLHVLTDLELWPVLADPGHLEQVLVNLAVNARDAMPGGGTLTIETRNIEVDGEYAASRPGLSPGAYVRLRVSDTGVGMDRATLQRVFEPFFTTKAKGDGTGLGLATVYGIVTQAGGHAQMYSEPGLGTTFTALFPATDQAVAAAAPTRPARPSATTGETVLVVEDEAAIREVARRILSRNGYTVLTAARGSEAIELARSHPGEIHLLLSDVVMPEMLGKEVAERVTRLRPRIRVLLMSGYAKDVVDGNGALPSDVLLVEKPFSEAVLLAHVAQVLDGAALGA